MAEYRYLMKTTDLELADMESALWQKVMAVLDSDRIQKVRRIKGQKAKASSACAGLLLQLACRKNSEEDKDKVNTGSEEDADRKKKTVLLEIQTVSEILSEIKKPADISVVYGEGGKPEIKDQPFFYNLSHSGDRVFCGSSDKEIGVDIQKIYSLEQKGEREKAPERILRIAERFFDRAEWNELASCMTEREMFSLFFRLWTRKEAIGKLHGDGLLKWIGRDLRDLRKEPWTEYIWEEYETNGYQITVCRANSLKIKGVGDIG